MTRPSLDNTFRHHPFFDILATNIILALKIFTLASLHLRLNSINFQVLQLNVESCCGSQNSRNVKKKKRNVTLHSLLVRYDVTMYFGNNFFVITCLVDAV